MRKAVILVAALITGACSFPTAQFRGPTGASDIPPPDAGAPETPPPGDVPTPSDQPPPVDQPPSMDQPPPSDTLEEATVDVPEDAAAEEVPPPLDVPPEDVPEDVPTDIPLAELVEVGCTSAAMCDDGNACTTDTCDTVGGACEHTARAACCTASAECDDGNACTTDSCTSNACRHVPIGGCCLADETCDDGNVCTVDTCNTATRSCARTPIVGCCTAATVAVCNDGNACTMDLCNETTRRCEHRGLAGCCTSNAQCDDRNPCTMDVCNTARTCVNTPTAGCCTSPSQCDDRDACTNNQCSGSPTTAGTCSYPRPPVPADNCGNIGTLFPSVNLQTLVVNTSCANNDFAEGPGRDVIYRFTLGTGTWLFYADTIGAGPPNESWDSELRLYGGPCGGPVRVANDDDGCGSLRSRLIAILGSGTYSLAIDGHNSLAAGLAQVHYRAVPIPSGVNVTTVSPGTTSLGGTTGSYNPMLFRCFPTFPASQVLTQSCVGSTANAPERVYATMICGNRMINANLCPSGAAWDTVLALRTDLTSSTSVFCNDDTFGACGNRSTITGTVTVPNVYFLVLDGYNQTHCGGYTINLAGF